MALGTFTVVIDADQLGAGTETSAALRVQFGSGRQFIKDESAGKFVFPHVSNSKPVAISLPYALELETDVSTGVSESIGYVVTVATASGGRVVAGPFAARAANVQIPLTDPSITSDFEGLVPESLAVRAEVAAAAAEDAKVAAEAVGSTNDTIIAGRINDPASATRTALSATYARLPGPLGGWKAKLASDPANAKMVKVGDSNSDGATGAGVLYRRLYGLHTQQGEALDGLGSADFYSDGVGNGTTTFTSATANFTADDVGRAINGANIPAATVITARNSATSVTLSNSVPSGSAVMFRVGRHIIAGGNNGRPLVDWLATPSATFPTMPYSRDRLVADAPDLIIHEWLTNDVREGLLGTTVDAIYTAGRARLKAYLDDIIADVPGADHLLVTPATFLTTNTGDVGHPAPYDFVRSSPGGTINPPGLAQVYSTALRRIYLSFVGVYPNVDVLDTQAEVFGTRSRGILSSNEPLMANQIHPSTSDLADLLNLTPNNGGYVAVADAIAKRIGFNRNAFPPARRTQHEFIVYSGPSAGTVRLISRDASRPAPGAPITRDDVLYVNGIDNPISLASATIHRAFSPQWVEITGLGSTDFSGLTGRTAMVSSAKAAPVGEGTGVYIDLASVPASTTVTVDVTVAGVMHGTVGYRAGVIAIPGGGFAASGLVLAGCYPKSENTVKLVIQNPTGAAIDPAGEVWTFLVVR